AQGSASCPGLPSPRLVVAENWRRAICSHPIERLWLNPSPSAEPRSCARSPESFTVGPFGRPSHSPLTMAPTDAPFPSSGVSARRWARVKNTARGVPNRSVDEDEERSARLSLRRAHSDSSIGALHSVCDLSTSASSREGSVVDAAAQRGGRALNEALLWADMEDDEPFLLDWPGSPSAKAAAQHQSHLCGWLPFAGENWGKKPEDHDQHVAGSCRPRSSPWTMLAVADLPG
ncbi:unnamed protein product, partial [Prorocentrum cordatum]